MIVDAFLYADEPDMLELRLRTLWDVVDLFVVCEADVTHAGADRLLTRPDQQPRFAPWAPRMQPLLVTDIPRFWVHSDLEVCQDCQHIWASHRETCWHVSDTGLCQCTRAREYRPSIPLTPYFQKRERHQRDTIARLRLSALPQDAVIFVSDVDEIWNPEKLDDIEKRLAEDAWLCLEQRFHGFALDYLHPHQPWLGTTVCPLHELAPQIMRDQRGDMAKLKDGGWHLSWFGTEKERARKLRTFSHQELEVDVDECYRTGKHSNGEQLVPIEMADYEWPAPILDGTFMVPPSWKRPR